MTREGPHTLGMQLNEVAFSHASARAISALAAAVTASLMVPTMRRAPFPDQRLVPKAMSQRIMATLGSLGANAIASNRAGCLVCSPDRRILAGSVRQAEWHE